MKNLIRFLFASILVVTTPVLAQTTAANVQPGNLQNAPQTNCVVGPCFVPYSNTNPLPVSSATTGGLLVGGYEFQIAGNPTVSTSALSAGQAAASLQSISIGSTNGLSGILTLAALESKAGTTANFELYIWSKNPVNTTCTAGSNIVTSQTDNQFLVTGQPLSLSPAIVLSSQDTMTYASATNLVGNFVNQSGNTNLYYCIVANASVTLGSSTDFMLHFQGVKDQP